MSKRYEIFSGCLAAAGLAFLILDGKTALTGAREGVELCLNTLVPTLFPFFFLSNILSRSLMRRRIPLLRPLGRLCHIPDGAEYIFLTGLIGGYPLGAQCISDACDSADLSARDGRRMLAFCNNCGPAFLFGMSAALFSDPVIPWCLFAIHLLSAILVGAALPAEVGVCRTGSVKRVSAVQALWLSVRAMSAVCGWVILFKVALAVLQRWALWYFPIEIQVAVSGILELSGGCFSLSSITDPSLRFILCAGFLGFGGLCVTMQTYFAAGRVDKDLYFPGKVLQGCISMALACLLCGSPWFVLPGALSVVVGIFLRKREKRCRNPQILVV